MRIDNDCIRDILFVIEKNSTIENPCSFHNASARYVELSVYDDQKIQYHLRNLLMANMIFIPDEYSKYPMYDFWVDLTPSGHEFLENVREDNNWNKIKSVSSSIGFASLKIITAISEGVATAAINKHLGFSE